MPAVYGLNLNSGFHADRFLAEPMFTWGNQEGQTDEQGNAGVRSVMFVAIKLLYVLGIRHVFLLGCDFRMTYGVTELRLCPGTDALRGAEQQPRLPRALGAAGRAAAAV